MTDKLKIAMVGCGAVTEHRHIPSFNKIKNKVAVKAACDRNIELAKKVAGKYGISGVYASQTEMLKNEKIDIVDVCTPPQIHAPVAIEALEHGCHVLMEKPMALTVNDCDKMIDAAKSNNRKLCVVHNVLFHPPLIKAKKLFKEGAIGDFRGMRILLSDPKDEMIMRSDYWIHKLPGGVIGETGPHPVYISLAFLDKINNLEIFTKNYLEHPWARFDEFRFELEANNGISSVAVSYSGERYAAEVEILGSRGALYVDLQSMLCLKYGPKTSLGFNKLISNSLSTVTQILGGIMCNGLKVITGRFKVGHDTVVELFIDSIINNTEPPVTGEDGREVIRVMEILVSKLNDKYGQPAGN